MLTIEQQECDHCVDCERRNGNVQGIVTHYGPLAAGFIFSIHFFNTHFRIEKFPMDTVIFSGRISHTEMLHERKRWYDRLVAAGKLKDYAIKDEWEGRKHVAKAVGFLFFGTGLVLLVLIVYAMVSRLGH